MDYGVQIEASKRVTELMAIKNFWRLSEKTQVLHPETGRDEVVMNRLSHSFMVSESAQLINKYIAQDLFDCDYKNSLKLVSLGHDLGHPAFGHAGTEVLSYLMKKQGLKEGFDDNNNTLTVLRKNALFGVLTGYEIASFVKYPKNLYPTDEKEIMEYLKKSINKDVEYLESQGIKFETMPKRTIACEIVDEADRNSYVTSDLSDCYCLEISNYNDIEKLIDTANFSNSEINMLLYALTVAIKKKDKTSIKKIFNKILLMFNRNYTIGKNAKLNHKDLEVFQLREDLFNIELEMFLKNKFILKQRELHNNYFQTYIKYVIEEKYFPSSTYRKKIENAKNETDYLRNIRDMIGETTDSYVINFVKNLSNKKINK
jgi:dGTP triphosphohydrolase